MKYSQRLIHAFTLIELLAVLAVTGVLAATMLPALARTKAAVARIYCTNNLKQIGVGFQTWGARHGGAYPMRVAAANGGYADYLGFRTLTFMQSSSRGVFGDFLVMSNELST